MSITTECHLGYDSDVILRIKNNEQVTDFKYYIHAKHERRQKRFTASTATMLGALREKFGSGRFGEPNVCVDANSHLYTISGIIITHRKTSQILRVTLQAHSAQYMLYCIKFLGSVVDGIISIDDLLQRSAECFVDTLTRDIGVIMNSSIFDEAIHSQTEKFWLLWNPDSSKPPQKRYRTEESAIKDAESMVAQGVAKQMYVLQPVIHTTPVKNVETKRIG